MSAEDSFSLRRMLTITRKELLVLFNNSAARFLIIVPPLMQIVIFGWAATLEVRNVEFAVLNNDNGSWSREILRRLEGSPTFTKMRWLSGEAELKPELDSQRSLFALVFNENFSRDIEEGRPAEVQVLMDGRRSNSAQIAASYLNEIITDVAKDSEYAKNAEKTARESGIVPRLDVRTRYWFNPNLEFQWFFLPNLIGMLSLMLGLVVTGLSVAREREMGTFDQLLVSPATPVEIALAKLVPGCLVGLAHGTIFIVISVFGFGIPITGSLLLLYISMLVFAFAAGGVGLMVSSISSTQQQAYLGAFAIGVPCILISGAVTPIMNMPMVLQWMSQLNPMRHFTVICQGVFLKDITLGAAMLNLGKIVAISIVAVSFAIWMFKRRH